MHAHNVYLGDAVSAEELARYLDLKKSDERAYTFEGVSCYNGGLNIITGKTNEIITSGDRIDKQAMGVTKYQVKFCHARFIHKKDSCSFHQILCRCSLLDDMYVGKLNSATLFLCNHQQGIEYQFI
ncbi:hypothetical protein L1987_80437 [Smallanthus sonchifolius]|uniref:Uncharacterized protein n=1 Tax=Smallanthus sonchifolius TaxID=185202 RepID=A0ACB8YM04_9ASTR|nr:hypothetical protein L1987_80437 [Smallanthus sonchifolius]